MTSSRGASPRRLGRYEIVERLAAGGMGEVFLACYQGPGGFLKVVALKRIHPEFASDESFVNMLLDEARLASSIQHPNIVSTLDVGCDDGEHYVVTEYVSGANLSTVLRDLHKRREAAPLWLVGWIGARIASALHAAHEARSLEGRHLDIVHRDVSLSNILLADQGSPMLFDFGVAKASQRLQQTGHGELKGKLAYMDPEIFLGAPVNRSVDIFSLGVVLYELLTQVSPFRRDTEVETISLLQSGKVPPPSKHRPEVDEELDSIVMGAMARKRTMRCKSAADLEKRLRAWARDRQQPHEAETAANWIAEVFPSEVRKRTDLLARAAASDPDSVSSATAQQRATVPDQEPEAPTVRTTAQATPFVDSPSMDGVARQTTTDQAVRAMRPGRWKVPLALLALVAGGSVVVATALLPGKNLPIAAAVPSELSAATPDADLTVVPSSAAPVVVTDAAPVSIVSTRPPQRPPPAPPAKKGPIVRTYVP